MSADQKEVEANKNRLGVAGVDSFGWSVAVANFGMRLTAMGRDFIRTTGQFFLFPLGVAGDIIVAILAWRQARIDNYHSDSVEKAWVETLGALAGTVAIALFAAVATGWLTLSALIIPIIFVGTLGARALYQLVLMLRSLTFFFRENSREKNAELRYAAFGHLIGFLSLGLMAVGIGLVIVGGYVQLAYVGVIAGGIGVLFAFYRGYHTYKAKQLAAGAGPPDGAAIGGGSYRHVMRAEGKRHGRNQSEEVQPLISSPSPFSQPDSASVYGTPRSALSPSPRQPRPSSTERRLPEAAKSSISRSISQTFMASPASSRRPIEEQQHQPAGSSLRERRAKGAIHIFPSKP